MESERPDALFRDPHARRLAGERGERIVASMRRGRAWAWPMIVRTAVLDELMLRTVERDGVDTVLNLAAGLDTRPYRLALPLAPLGRSRLPRRDRLQAGAARRGAAGVRARARGDRPHRRRAAARPVRPDRHRGTRGSGGDRGAVDLPDAGAGRRARLGSRRARTVPPLAHRPRVTPAAQDDGTDLGARRGRRERPVPVRARGGFALLPGAGLARSGVPLDVGGGAPSQTDDAARLAVEPGRTAVSQSQAGGIPAHVRHHPAQANLKPKGPP